MADEENSATLEAVDEFASSRLKRVCYLGEWRRKRMGTHRTYQ